MKISRYAAAPAALIAVVCSFVLRDSSAAAPVCTYNDRSTSFGSTYANHQQTGVASAACTSSNPPAAERLAAVTKGVASTTAPNTGDFRFLMRNQGLTKIAPVLSVGVSDDPEVLNFPDPNIAAPSPGGCGLATVGIPRLEGHLHRSWPLFGQTYYYGEPNSDPPMDPLGVTSAASPYNKWAPFNPADFYRYKDPTNYSGATKHGWGASLSGLAAADTAGLCKNTATKPKVDAGYGTAAAACSAAGLSVAEQAVCTACLAGVGPGTGYYLQDGAVTGDLMKSVFRGDVLNDYPPAWTSLSWAASFFINYDVGVAKTGSAMFQLRRNLNQITVSASGNACPTPNMQQIGTPGVPACADVNPWNQASIDAKQKTYCDDQANFNGGNSIWGKPVVAGKQWHTPAGDILKLGKDAKSVLCAGQGACQVAGILYVGFGVPCGEGNPTDPFTNQPLVNQNLSNCTGECQYVNPDSTCSASCSNQNHIAEASHYLYNSQSGIVSYFIGMGAHTSAMRRAAAEGHGKYFDAQDVEGLHDALISVLNSILDLGTSSATSTINTVQVNVAGQEELVPRFVALEAAPGDAGVDGGIAPTTGSSTAIWDGHLYKYFLFSEYAANCTKAGDTAQIPNSAAPVCTATCVCAGGSCDGRWLVDSECSLIAPDKSGFFFKANYQADAGTGLVPTNAPGIPVWDASKEIAKVNWWERPVYTAIDTNADGVINYQDGNDAGPPGMYLLTQGATAGNANLTGGVSDAVASALAPYLGIHDTQVCADIEGALAKALPDGGAAYNRDTACARVILNFALGEDLTDQNQTGTLVSNRLSMLGDIFHSSPQDIGPPPAEDLCGLNNRRCMTTIFNVKKGAGLPDYQSMETPANVVDPASGNSVTNSANLDAYSAYYQDQAFGLKLPRVSIFGTNDGLVHGVQTGCYVKAATLTNPLFPSSIPIPVYWEGVGTGSGSTACVAGNKANGTELWAFISPSQLAKLSQLILAKHQYFVDGTAMVRDIYAGSSATKSYNSTQKDFKRIAIFGEREGGTHWFGLDVTDPTKPHFQWLFPQPNSPDELKTGLTFNEWQPAAPPIVPIRLQTTASGYPTYNSTSFQEKWVTLLPGGYDPYGVRGKSVYMLDAYTGAKLYEATGATGQDFPFTAMPSAIAWGTSAISATPAYNKGYFDTAVIGDLGGQVWTMRFNDPGHVNTTSGLVDNWLWARSFRQYKGDDSGTSPYKMQHRVPIFQMASVARMNEGTLRAYFSTGDRANMSDKGLGQCSIYNPAACGKQNCVMTYAWNASVGGNSSASGISSYNGAVNGTYSTSSSFSYSPATSCAPAATTLNSCVTCTGGGSGSTNVAPAEPQFSCANGSSGTAWKCADLSIPAFDTVLRLETTTGTVTPSPYNDRGYFSRFVAFNLFDSSGSRNIFTDSTTATAYDGAALTETDLKDLFNGGTFDPVSPPKLNAAAGLNGASKGFFFGYPMIDERTATNSLLLQNCLSWYTMAPGAPCNVNADCPSGSTCNATSHECSQALICGSSTAIPARTAFLYQVNASDGSTNCGLTSSTGLRMTAPGDAFIVPPPPAQPLVSVNSKGNLQYSIIAPAGQFSPPAAAAGAGSTSQFSFFYTMELPRELHVCRHQPTDGGANVTACMQ